MNKSEMKGNRNVIRPETGFLPTKTITSDRIIMKLHFKWLLIAVCASALLILGGSGCKNTAHGVGKDVEKVGEKIQEKTK